jgi:hypothetical protein
MTSSHSLLGLTTVVDPRGQAIADSNLFATILVGMHFHRLFGVCLSMARMAARAMSVVCRLLVVSSGVVFCSFLVMTSGMGVVLGSLLVVFCSFL